MEFFILKSTLKAKHAYRKTAMPALPGIPPVLVHNTLPGLPKGLRAALAR